MMSKIIIPIFALVLINSFTEVSAQEPKEQKSFNREAFESKRNAFITAEVGLTPEEAASFIPLCNEMQKKKFEAGKECRKKSREVRKAKEVKDELYKEVLDICLESRIKEAEIEKAYYTKFQAILSPEKIYKYRCAEMKFGRLFVKERNRKK